MGLWIDKPEWVNHDGEALTPLGLATAHGALPPAACSWQHAPAGKQLFSVDIDCTSARVCTSGEDCKVKVWDFVSVSNAAAEQSSRPRLLASLSDHTGPVNTARFSPSGRQLASGSDDKLVLLYVLNPGPGRAQFGAPQPAAGHVMQCAALVLVNMSCST